jgi:hypothetical protein
MRLNDPAVYDADRFPLACLTELEKLNLSGSKVTDAHFRP